MSHVTPDEKKVRRRQQRSKGHVDDDKNQSGGLEKVDALCSQGTVRSQA
jgi:hypothetical protein